MHSFRKKRKLFEEKPYEEIKNIYKIKRRNAISLEIKDKDLSPFLIGKFSFFL